MIQLRKSDERGRTQTDWLDSYHSFSFNSYYHPQHIQFGPLRVLNEDYVKPSQGFPRHAHQNMEIVTYVISGSLKHEDSSGGSGVIRAGEVQKMSAGSGIIHSEYNGSDTEPVHFIQIWLLPEQKNIKPYYEQKFLNGNGKINRFHLIAGPEPSEHSLMIHQDARISCIRLEPGFTINHDADPSRGYYIFIIDGNVETGGVFGKKGDGIIISGESFLRISSRSHSHVLLFDLSMRM